METKATKPALPLRRLEADDSGHYVADVNGAELSTFEVAWLNAAAAAHGPALKALIAVTEELEAYMGGPRDMDENELGLLQQARKAIALMEKAPEPTP